MHRSYDLGGSCFHRGLEMQVVRACNAPNRQSDHLAAEDCQRGSVQFFLREVPQCITPLFGDGIKLESLLVCVTG